MCDHGILPISPPARTPNRVRRKAVSICLGTLLMLTGALAQTSIGPGSTVVRTRLGGFILGYDIDQNGTEGVLAESLSLGDGNYNVAVETFDQKTGKTIKLVSGKKETQNDFVALGIVQNQVGLVEAEIVKDFVVNKR